MLTKITPPPFFGKRKIGNKRSFYLFGIKILEYTKKDKKQYKEKIDKQSLSIKISKFNDIGVTETVSSKQLIVSLTSYPARMNNIHFTLYSLLTQTLKPNKLILWLASSQFPNREADIPEEVLRLKKNGLTIKWCKDLRSFKKIIPALQEFPNDIIVTADDDLFYEKDWLERLCAEYSKHKDEKFIFCHRSHGITFNKQEVNPFGLWSRSNKNKNYEATSLNFCTTGAGVLYPPGILHKDVLKEHLFFYLTPFHDDLWLWAMAVLNGVKIKQVEKNIPKLKPVSAELEASNDGSTLYSVNRILHDLQFRYLCEFYPDLKKILLKDKNTQE